MRIRLKACDICGATTSKEDVEFHLAWHDRIDTKIAELEGRIDLHLTLLRGIVDNNVLP